MKPQLQIHIPKPCHEDWNKMTPVDKGKFCSSCNKQVVDFSLMSDQQVLNYFSTATGKTCGRFDEDQLQRELIPTKIEKKKTWWFAALMPLLLFFDKATAQKKNVTTLGTPAIIKKDTVRQLMGKVAAPVFKDNAVLLGEVTVKKESIRMVGDTIVKAFCAPVKKDEFIINDDLLIIGRVLDENGNPVPFATINMKKTFTSFSADVDGNFHTKASKLYNSIIIEVSAVGYETKQVEITAKESGNISISLRQKEIKLPDVIVTTQINLLGNIRVGGAYSVCTIKKVEKIDTAIRKAFRNQTFKAYPNPVPNGSLLHIEIKNAGNYSIQLLDNSSKLISVDEFIAASNHVVTSVEIPSTLAAGIYYIRVIDERKKKSYVDKIVIQ